MSEVQVGRWDPLFPLEVGGVEIAIEHAALLRTAQVIFLSDEPYTLLWDPSNETSPQFNLLPNSATGLTVNLVCGGHSFLSDGRLLVVGGGGLGAGNPTSVQAWIFDPITLRWSQTSKTMSYRRWYPTCVTLGGSNVRKILVAGGSQGTTPAPHMELYDESSGAFTVVNASGEKLFGQTYPGLNLLPNGNIFYTPVGFGECRQIARVFAQTEPSGYFRFSTPNTGQWIDTGINRRTKGMQVILLQRSAPFVRIMVAGGGNVSRSKTAQVISPSDPSPNWSPPFLLLENRVHPNLVLLPDNSVLICGGMTDQGPPLRGGRCELYNSLTNATTEMASLNYPRHYHSTALLLPSGKVLAAGGSGDQGCGESLNNPIEVFSPPYLFKGPRPNITNVPNAISLGSTFEIGTSDSANISTVSLMRPMAVTHQTDTEQRLIPLSFSISTNTKLLANAPDGNPPIGAVPIGYYMLFILNKIGVPSVGRFVLIS